MAKRIPWKTIELSKLQHLPEGSGGWNDYKWENYLLRRSETKDYVTESKIRVNYRLDKSTKTWHVELPRYKYYTRRKKYLCVEGPLSGQWHTAQDTIGSYKLYWTDWSSDDVFPRKVLLATDALAKKLGLKW